MRKLYFVVLMLISGLTYGQTFSGTYDFTLVTTSSGTTDPTPPPTAAGLTFGAFNAVGTPANPNATIRFSFTDWSTTVINTAEYYQVTLTPAVNYSIDLNTIVFRIQRSGTGIRHYSVRSDIDAYAANQPASINPANATLSVVATDVFEITDNATFQDGSTITLGTGFDNLTAPVTFRFYGFDAEAAGGTFSIDNVTFNGVATFSGVVTDYFSKPAGNLTDVATWGTNTDGTGTSPTDFTTDGQEFNVVNRVSTTLDANWTVSGAASKVIVGEGTTGTELILPNTAALTGTVDVTNLSTLRLENSTLPTFGTLATGSTVNYAQTASPYVVPTSTTYYNLSITNGVKTLNTGTITVNGNLVLDGVTDFNGSGSPFTTIALSGDFSMINGATFVPSPAGDVPRLTLNCVSTGATQTLSGGSFLLFRLQTTVTSAAALNIALAANANLQFGNTSSGAGGLNIINPSQTLSLLGNNVVTFYGFSRFQATNFGTISGNSTSTLNIAPTGSVATIGTIGFTPGFQQLGTLNINSSFAGDNTLTLSSPLTITNDLNFTAGYINIGNYNLTVAGNITGGSGAGFVQTTGTGTLTKNGIGASTVIFPIGNLTYNPIAISNGSNNNFSARVALGIVDPTGAIPVDAVERTWYIGANVVTAGVTIGFEYNTSDCSPGATAQPLTMQIMQSDYTTWHLSLGNGAILATSPAPWTVTSVAPLTINNGLIPYTLGVSGTAILAVDYFITAKAQKQNNNALISWTVGNAAGVNNFEVQRSVGNGAYQTIGTVAASSGQVNYQFTDFATDKGTNLYRIRVNRLAGGVRYSNTVAVINGSNGLLITGLWPNPAQDKAQLTLSTAKAGAIRFELYALNGVMVKSWTAAAAEGTNVMTLSTGDLRAGVYQLVATGQEARSVFRFIKQ